MYHTLTKKEMKGFIKRYLNPFDDYTKNIKHISMMEYNGVKEYLINNKYMLKVYS